MKESKRNQIRRMTTVWSLFNDEDRTFGAKALQQQKFQVTDALLVLRDHFMHRLVRIDHEELGEDNC